MTKLLRPWHQALSMRRTPQLGEQRGTRSCTAVPFRGWFQGNVEIINQMDTDCIRFTNGRSVHECDSPIRWTQFELYTIWISVLPGSIDGYSGYGPEPMISKDVFDSIFLFYPRERIILMVPTTLYLISFSIHFINILAGIFPMWDGWLSPRAVPIYWLVQVRAGGASVTEKRDGVGWLTIILLIYLLS